ncbi:hypothetical protein [uncultured Nonlabens sp.]|jgi:hypothetical protein|uniref:hypothetical protein n=1 Tax=uncultured Nonlabens sp. TaxID=859306 RepID=UPI0030DDA116|tara:strand:- start:17770 stop:19005 length:1236 start_codon:yes stop_codon:yes gene_type:complete
MRNLHRFINFLILIAIVAMSFSCSENKELKKVAISPNAFQVKAPMDQVVTRKGIDINFKTFDKNSYKLLELLISGTYGTTVLKAKLDHIRLNIHIPNVISRHAGMLTWELIGNGKTIQKGTFRLLPNTKTLKTMENYVGPRSIISNDRDYTMLVSIPVDSLDNMLPDKTPLIMRHQFKGNITTTTQEITTGFAWQRILAPLTTGRLITGSTMETISSKELVVDVFPDIATAFKISENSNHNYADGSEIITLKTDQIKDRYGNITTDGTLVTFFIKDNLDKRWQTTGSTINGYAFAKALHPQTPSAWTIKGVITGMVESPELNINFQSIIDQIPFTYTENNRITIGPLTSYLGQLVPDGIPISIKLNAKEIILKTKNGIATHSYDTKMIAPGTYNLEIKTLGVTTVKPIILR